MDSDIMLMDEPFSALDPLIRAQLQDELLVLQRELKKTILFVTHDLDEALKIGSNIGIMEAGRIIQHGAPEDIVLNPVNDYVQSFVAHTNPMNVLKANKLMIAIADLVDQAGRIELGSDCWMTLENGQIQQMGRGPDALNWSESTAKPGQFAVITEQTGMRDAVAKRHATGLPLVVRDERHVTGVLNDDRLYYALLGKHFEPSSTG